MFNELKPSVSLSNRVFIQIQCSLQKLLISLKKVRKKNSEGKTHTYTHTQIQHVNAALGNLGKGQSQFFVLLLKLFYKYAKIKYQNKE